MSEDDPDSDEWRSKLARTIVAMLMFTSLVFNPRRVVDNVVGYASLLSLWPLTVGPMVYFLYRYPSKAMAAYVLLFFMTHRKDAKHNGSQVSKWLGNGWMAKSIARLTEANLHTPHLARMQELAKSGTKFVLGVHPHSIFGISTLIHFALNRLVTKDIFGPNIDFRVLTININLIIPLLREYLMSRGFVCADAQTFKSLIDRGISPVIVPGGAEETLYTYPGSADLVASKRLGFVREALLNGAWLIPVYCFGDNEKVPVFTSKRIRYWQRVIQKCLTFATPFVIPIFKSGPIHMVIGEPLPPPTEGDLGPRTAAYHAQYLQALAHMFKNYVSEYGTTAEKAGKGIRFVK